MRVVLFIFLCCFICGWYTNKITVIDAHTLQPVPDALVLTNKHYKLFSYFRAYKTNKNGIVYLDYNPTSIYAGKKGYWLGRDDNPNVVFLVANTENPASYTWNKKFPSLYVPYEYLSKTDPLYNEWRDFYQEQQRMMSVLQNAQH